MVKGFAFCLALAASLLPSLTVQAAERLQVPQIPGWVVVSSVHDANGESTELIPEGQTRDGWTRRIAVQAFRAVTLGATDFLDQVVQQTAPVCDAAAAGPASPGRVNGAPAGSRAVACSRYKGDGMGTYTLYFVVRGRSALYVVSRIWRGPAFDPAQSPVDAAEMQDWIAYMNSIDLCGYDSAQTCR